MQAMPEMAQPEEIVVPLLPYQRQFLAWAITQEQSTVRGGILADEMGMGKTLQVRAGRKAVLQIGWWPVLCCLVPHLQTGLFTDCDDTLSCCMQAISVIVTHRTDDMRKLPPSLANTTAGATHIDSAAHARPRLAMRSALAKGVHDVPVGGPVPMDSSAAALSAGPSLSTMAVGTLDVQPDKGVSDAPSHRPKLA